MNTNRLRPMSAAVLNLTQLRRRTGRSLLTGVAFVLFVQLITTLRAVQLDLSASVNPNPVNICEQSATLTTRISNLSGTPAPVGTITQTLPIGCTLNNVSPSCAGVQVTVNQNIVTYDFVAPIADQSTCIITADLIISCDAIHSANATLAISHKSGQFTFAQNPADSFFQASRPIINIVDFYDDETPPSSLSPNAEQSLLVSPNRRRQFDLLVSDGVVGAFALSYTPESEIKPIGLELEGILASGVSTLQTVALPAPSANPHVYQISNAQIKSLFPNQTAMTFGQRIRVRENFHVIHCSPAQNDATRYAVAITCPRDPKGECPVSEIKMSILVQSSTGGIWPAIGISPPLDLCGIDPSDITIQFNNSGPDPAGLGKTLLPGSATKSMHTIGFPMNLDAFTSGGAPINLASPPLGTIFLEGAGASVDIASVNSAYNGFYTYDPLTHWVTLNFDVLTGQPLGPNGPLVSAFIPETPAPIFNEFVNSGVLRLRFRDMRFHCAKAVLNADQSNPFDFDDWPKPVGGAFFFQRRPADYWRFEYENMCQAKSHDYADYAGQSNNFPITAIAEASKTDVQPSEHATLNFYYQPQSGAYTSPFVFDGALTGVLYFHCKEVEYRATVTIPELYDLAGVNYAEDPNNPTASTTLAVPAPVLAPAAGGAAGTKTYRFNGLKNKGLLSLDVVLTTCPEGTFGFDKFTTRIDAICDGCADCAYTVTCFSTELFHHCLGECKPGPPQGTKNFSFNRADFGWTDHTMTTQVTPGAGISLNRAYNCDAIEMSSDGQFDPTVPTAATKTALGFAINYEPEENFQFFEFLSGSLTYDRPGGSTTYAINPATDLSGSFKGAPTGWPAGKNETNHCVLWITFPPSVLADLMADNTLKHLSIKARLRVKPMKLAPSLGYHNIPQIRAQYYTDNEESCDPWGDNMMVLNIRTGSSFVVREAFDANESIGWPFPTGVCERHFMFETWVSGGLPSLDNFPNEFRPVVKWPGPKEIKMQLPQGVHYLNSYFSAFGRPGWENLYQFPVNITQSGSTVSLETWQASDGPHDWPILEMDGFPNYMMIRGSFRQDCPATQNNPIDPVVLEFPFISGLYTADPDCRTVHPTPQSLPFSPSLPIGIKMTGPANPFHITSTTSKITGLKFVHFQSWNTIENCWVRFSSPGLTVNSVSRLGASGPIPATHKNGYFELGHIAIGDANAAELILDVTLTHCQPGELIPVTVEYGYDCAGYPQKYPPERACIQQSHTFDVLPERTGMSMTVIEPAKTAGPSCDTYEYKVNITSTGIADLENLALEVDLPPGIQIAAGKPQTYTTGSNPGGKSGVLQPPIQTGQTLHWNLNHDIYSDAGMPPTPAQLELVLTLTGSCNPSLSQPGFIVFRVLGENLCGGKIAIPTHSSRLDLREEAITLSCPADLVLDCPAKVEFKKPTIVAPCEQDLTLSFKDLVLDVACPNVSAVKRTWTATDRCGRTASCSQTITLQDTTPPVLSGCKDRIINVSPGKTSATVLLGVTATDNCSPAPKVTCTPPSGNFPIGTTTVTCVATDDCGNATSCSFRVLVRTCVPEENSPCLTQPCQCQEDLVFDSEPGKCDAAVEYNVLEKLKGCETNLFVECTPPSGSRFPLGTTQVKCGISDGTNILRECLFNVTVRDSSPPLFQNCTNLLVRVAPGAKNALVSYPVTATSASGVTLTFSPPNPTRFPLGTNRVCATAVNGCGTTNTCCFLVVVHQSMPPILCGQAVATCFSGLPNPAVCLSGYISTNPVVGVIDVNAPGSHGATLGAHWGSAPMYHGEVAGAPTWTAANLGQVFGVTLDSATPPNIYVTAAGFYFGLPPGGPGGPGAVYRIDGKTAAISVYAKLPNGGVGLGNIAHDPVTGQFYVSNFEDGRIYRLPASTLAPAAPLSPLSAFDHGTQGRIQLGLTALADNPALGSTQLGRRIWGVQVRDGRLYYAVWNENGGNAYSPLYSINTANEVWSLALDTVGNFQPATARRELTLPALPPNVFRYGNGLWSSPVSDIKFSPDGSRMLLSERSVDGPFPNNLCPANNAHKSRVLEYSGCPGNWVFEKEFYIGDYYPSASDYLVNSSAGGADYSCDGLVWATGDYLLDAPRVYGLLGMPAKGNTVATARSGSYLIDLDGNFGGDKTQIGSVVIQRCCECFDVTDSTLRFDPRGGFELSLCIRNRSGRPMAHLSFPTLPTGLSITPDIIKLPNPIPDGQTRCVTVHIDGPTSVTEFCFRIGLHGDVLEDCCSRVVRVEAPNPCPIFTDLTSSGRRDGLCDFCFTIVNRSPWPMTSVDLTAGMCMGFAGRTEILAPPLMPGQSRSICVTASMTSPPFDPSAPVFRICGPCLDVRAFRPGIAQPYCTNTVCFAPCWGIATDKSGSHTITNISIGRRIPIRLFPAIPAGVSVPDTHAVPDEGPFWINWRLDDGPFVAEFLPPYGVEYADLPLGEHVVTGEFVLASGATSQAAPLRITVRDHQEQTPEFRNVHLDAGKLVYTVSTEVGVFYHIEASASLNAENWTTTRSFTGNGASLTFQEDATAVDRRFFRIRIE